MTSASVVRVPRMSMPAAVKAVIVIAVVSFVASGFELFVLAGAHRAGDLKDASSAAVWFNLAMGSLSKLLFEATFAAALIMTMVKALRWARAPWAVVLGLNVLAKLPFAAVVYRILPALSLILLIEALLSFATMVLLYLPATFAWFAQGPSLAAGRRSAAPAATRDAPRSTPEEVQRAVWIGGAGFAAGILRDLIGQFQRFSPQTLFVVVMLAGFCLAAGTFLNHVADGARWARAGWAWAAGGHALFAVMEFRRAAGFEAIGCVIEIVLISGSVVLLYREPASEWFE